MCGPGINREHPTMPANVVDPLDRLVEGAEEIAFTTGLVDKNGQPKTRRAYYLLERKILDADKHGRIWSSTPRRLLKLPRDSKPTGEVA
jgi:hypothetical protein